VDDASSSSPHSGRGAMLAGERRSNSSMEDSGYPQSICGSERVLELRSPCTTSVSEDAFSSSTSPMEFLSPAALGEGEKECRESGKNVGLSESSVGLANLSLAADGNRVAVPDLDMLLTATSGDPEMRGMFEPGDLVIYNEARGRADENLDLGLDSAFSTVDLLDRLNEKEMSVGDSFLNFDVQGLCNSMFSLETHVGRGAGTKGEVGASEVGRGAVNPLATGRSGGSGKSRSSSRKKSSGRRVVPSWKVRSQNFQYDEDKEMESVKMVYARSKRDHDSQKWEEIESALQNWKKLDSTTGYFRELSSDGLGSLEDFGVDSQMDFNFDQQIFNEVINTPLPAVANSAEGNGETNTEEEDVDVTTVYPPSDEENGEGGKEKGPRWVGQICRRKDQSSNDSNVLLVVRSSEKSNSHCDRSTESGSNTGLVRVNMKKPMVRLVRLKGVPRRSAHFQLKRTGPEDICTSREDARKESDEVEAVQCSGSNVGVPVELGQAKLPEIAASSERCEGGPLVTRLDKVGSPEEIVNIMASDADLVPFSASDLPPEPALQSGSVSFLCSVEAPPITISESPQDVSVRTLASASVEATPVKLTGSEDIPASSIPTRSVTVSSVGDSSSPHLSPDLSTPISATPPLDSKPPSNEISSISGSVICATRSSSSLNLQAPKPSDKDKRTTSTGTVKRLKKKIILKTTRSGKKTPTKEVNDKAKGSETARVVQSCINRLKSPPMKLASLKPQNQMLSTAMLQSTASPRTRDGSLPRSKKAYKVSSDKASSSKGLPKMPLKEAPDKIPSRKAPPKVLSSETPPNIPSNKGPSSKVLSSETSPKIASNKALLKVPSSEATSKVPSSKATPNLPASEALSLPLLEPKIADSLSSKMVVPIPLPMECHWPILFPRNLPQPVSWPSQWRSPSPMQSCQTSLRVLTRTS